MFDRVLDLQRQAGNAAVARLLADPVGPRERLGIPPVGRTAFDNGATPSASAAVTFTGGRGLFADGQGATTDKGPDVMTKVATILGTNLTKHDEDRAAPAPSGGADVEYEKSRPVVEGHSVDEQIEIVFDAVMKARHMLDSGFQALMGFDSLPERSMNALDQNFHNVNRSASPTRVSHMDEIRESIAKTRRAFDQPIPVEIETDPDGRTLGYVKVHRLFGPEGNIHLLPLWFTKDPDYRAQVVVHEACHRFDNDDDHAYRWEKEKYGHLSVKEAIDNADSYAWFCDDVN